LSPAPVADIVRAVKRSAKSPATKSPKTSKRSSKPARGPTPPGDDLGAADLSRRLSERLHLLRKARHWSLDELSRASGVSRASLWQIETQRSNPSIGVLWKVATGLGLPFSDLFGDAGGQVMVQRRTESPVVHSRDGKLESRLVSPPGGAIGIELFELRLAAHSKHSSEAHRSGTREVVAVLSGALRIEVGEAVYEAGAGDAIAFAADRAHAYVNPGQGEARYHDLIIYGR
jgi:XRE family transcriptional regulator, regulator of sulfur utilization